MRVNPAKPRKLGPLQLTVLAQLKRHGRWLVYADRNEMPSDCTWTFDSMRPVATTRQILDDLMLRGLVKSRRLNDRPDIICYTPVGP